MIAVLVVILLILLFNPPLASAHAFGQLYNLPVPFWMYLYGSASAITLSFLIIGFFVNKQTSTAFSSKTLVKSLSFLTNPTFLLILRIVSLSIFLGLLLVGIIGEDSATNNISMTFFWIIFVLGISYFIGIFGNIWPVINPIKIITSLFGSSLEKGYFRYPKKLGYYPALIFYFFFIWIELFGEGSPSALTIYLTEYLFLQIIGIVIFGRHDWLKYGEFFSVFFNLLGKMGIFESSSGKLYFRFPFSGLLDTKADHFSMVLFILFMLSSTAFDGFSSTGIWQEIYLLFYELLYPMFEDTISMIVGTIGLFISPFIFLCMYVLFIFIAKIVTKSKKSLMNLMLEFAYSLIPIAFVYNIAHYFTLLITEGQNMYWLISDPLGYGWNIFGTKGDFVIFIPDISFIWHAQVGMILVGHIVGVYIAHLLALKIFPSHKQAMLSQLPMLILMVLYTMVGLWILSQPITAEI